MRKGSDQELPGAALIGLKQRRLEIERHIADLKREIGSRQPRGSTRSRKRGTTGPEDPGESLREKLKLPAAFENKAGQYELIRIDGETVYYEFTNRHGATASRAMPAVTWRILGSRARPPE